MYVIHSEGRVLQLPGSRLMEYHPTRRPEAWKGHYFTVLLHEGLPARRVARRETDLFNDWFALDCPPGLSSVDIARRYAIPEPQARRVQGSLVLPRGTVLNVGVCAPLFGQPGGGAQGEWIDGPFVPVLTHMTR